MGMGKGGWGGMKGKERGEGVKGGEKGEGEGVEKGGR